MRFLGCLIDIFTSQVNINITSLENSSSSNKKIIKSFDINGREVDEKTRGVLFQINNIGEVKKKINSTCDIYQSKNVFTIKCSNHADLQ